jgi:hypothetical protein
LEVYIGTVTVAATEEYNGTSWTNGGNLATARNNLGGAGTQTSGLGFGGSTTISLAATEEYSGAGTATTRTVTAT